MTLNLRFQMTAYVTLWRGDKSDVKILTRMYKHIIFSDITMLSISIVNSKVVIDELDNMSLTIGLLYSCFFMLMKM